MKISRSSIIDHGHIGTHSRTCAPLAALRRLGPMTRKRFRLSLRGRLMYSCPIAIYVTCDLAIFLEAYGYKTSL